jgi:putative ABC transport system substrate-binding protein
MDSSWRIRTVKRGAVLGMSFCLLAAACSRPVKHLYTIGVLELLDSGTTREVRRGLLQAFADGGLRDGVNVRIDVRNGKGDISEVHRLARAFVGEAADLIIPTSTQSLQAALIATSRIPVVFSSVANPYLAGAGVSATEHLANVTGVASTGPIREALAILRQVFPAVRRVGTLWTPSEMNSEYYLELAREAASEFGFDIVPVPVDNPSSVLLAAQVLVNKKIGAIYQISDNTINASFEALSKVADENAIPLFSGSLLAVRAGAAAAVGWDFYAMGYKSGQLALRVKNGESPALIPFQVMSDVRLALNLPAARRQGVTFPDALIKRANEILD